MLDDNSYGDFSEMDIKSKVSRRTGRRGNPSARRPQTKPLVNDEKTKSAVGSGDGDE